MASWTLNNNGQPTSFGPPTNLANGVIPTSILSSPTLPAATTLASVPSVTSPTLPSIPTPTSSAAPTLSATTTARTSTTAKVPGATPTPSDPSAGSSNSLNNNENSSTSVGVKTAIIVGGVLGAILIAALLIVVLVYRYRRRSRFPKYNGFEYGAGAANAMSGTSSCDPLVETGVVAGTATATYASLNKAQTDHKDNQIFDRQQDYSIITDDNGDLIPDIAITTDATHTHYSFLKPPPAALTPISRSLSEAASALSSAATSPRSDHHSSYLESGLQISPPVWVPHRYDTSSPSVMEYDYRKSTATDYYGAESLEGQSETVAETSFQELPKSDAMQEIVSPAPIISTTDTVSPRGERAFTFNVSDMVGSSLADAVVAASRLENGEDDELLNVQAELPQPESDLSDIVSLRPNDMTNGEEEGTGRSSSAILPNIQSSPSIAEGSDGMTEADLPNQTSTLSTLISSGFNPEVMFGIPSNPSGRRSQDDNGEGRSTSVYYDDRRSSIATFATTRAPEQRTPSFVGRDSAFFADE